MRFSPFFLALACVSLTSLATAGSLQDVRQAAEQADPQWLAAQRTWEADRQLEVQARGSLLPGVSATYRHMRMESKPVNSGSGTMGAFYASNATKGDNISTSINLSQPLFRLDAWYGYKQARAIVSANEAVFAQSRQDFLLRVATQYMSVLNKRDALQFAMANERALARQLEQTKERFNVGLVPITDVQQAQSVYDNASVTLIAAKSQYAIARDQLESLTNKSWDKLAALKADLPMDGVSPADPAKWIELAQQNNPQLIASQMAAKAQAESARVKTAAMLPQVNLLASYQDNHNVPRNNTALGRDGPDTHNKSIGVEVTMPLFAGGLLNSQRKQAALQAEAAEATSRAAFRDVSQAARSQYRMVETDAESVKAGAQAIKSAETALAAVEEGYKVGTTTIIDVLNAESLLFSARSNYANARYNYVIDSLTLKATAGVLAEKDLDEVNNWLDAANPVDLETVTLPEQEQPTANSP